MESTKFSSVLMPQELERSPGNVQSLRWLGTSFFILRLRSKVKR